jgi:hypothetical protein
MRLGTNVEKKHKIQFLYLAGNTVINLSMAHKRILSRFHLQKF